jgi:hypothetical protein
MEPEIDPKLKEAMIYIVILFVLLMLFACIVMAFAISDGFGRSSLWMLILPIF